MSDSVRPHGWQPTRLPHPWDSPGKNTGVGCHVLLQRMKVKSDSELTQSCLTLSNPMDCSPPDSSVHGIFQARVLEWGAIAFSQHRASDDYILTLRYVLYLVAQSCPTLCNPRDCSLPDTSVHGDSPGKNTRVGDLSLLQGIFPTQGSNPGLPHCRQILYQLVTREAQEYWSG